MPREILSSLREAQRLTSTCRMVVTITLADGGGSNEDLAAAADRLLSGFSFDHRFVFRTEEAPR